MNTNFINVPYLVIGAGVVGLSIAREISKKVGIRDSVFLIERHSKFGQETSSRNSEVIHGGLYYGVNSLKARHCVRGKELLYEYLENKKIPYKKCGKFIVAYTENEFEQLISLKNVADSLNVEASIVDKAFVSKSCSLTTLHSALWSPSTGIFDSHSFMENLSNDFREYGGISSYSTSVQSFDVKNGRLLVNCSGPGEDFIVQPEYVVNAAGLSSAKIHKMIEPNSVYQIKPCRGRYYVLKNKFRSSFNQLIYPLPTNDGGLGVHITMDMSGQLRLGPDVDWVNLENLLAGDERLLEFPPDDNLKERFFIQGKRFLPKLEMNDLFEGYVGIRPKLFYADNYMNDFKIEQFSTEGVMVFSLLGIESPGLTASLSLARSVVELI